MNRSILIAVCDFMIISILAMGVFQTDMASSKKGTSVNAQVTPVFNDLIESTEMLIKKQKVKELKLKNDLIKKNKAIQKEQEKNNELNQKLSQSEQTTEKLEHMLKDEKGALLEQENKISELSSQLTEVKKNESMLSNQLNEEKNKSSQLDSQVMMLKNNLKAQEKIEAQQKERIENLRGNIEEKKQQIQFTQGQLESSIEERKLLENKMSAIVEQTFVLQKKLDEKNELVTQTQQELKGLTKDKGFLNEQMKRLEEMISDQKMALELAKKEVQQSSIIKDSVNQKALESQSKLLTMSEELIQKEKELADLKKTKEVQKNQIETLENRLSDFNDVQSSILKEINLLKNQKNNLMTQNEELTQKMSKLASDALKIKQQEKVYSNNELYKLFLKNKVSVEMRATSTFLFKKAEFNKEVLAIPVEDEGKKGLLLHYKDTPLNWIAFSPNMHE